MNKFLSICGLVVSLLGAWTLNATAYQNDCLASVANPTWLAGQSVPCNQRLDGGAGMHFLDQLGGEHVDPSEALGYLRVTGAVVVPYTGMTGITTNTTSSTFTLPSGGKHLVASVTGTGAVAVNVKLFGDMENTTTHGEQLCATIALSGTTKAIDDCAQFSTDYPFYHVTTDAISGTGATVEAVIYTGIASTGAVYSSTIDPCSYLSKIYVPISQVTGTQLITGTASRRTFVCQLTLNTATAQNFALVSGTGTVCATSTAAMIGGTTAATGFIASANWGIVLGNGAATVTKSTVDANNICILMSSTGQLSGVISYVVAANQ